MRNYEIIKKRKRIPGVAAVVSLMMSLFLTLSSTSLYTQSFEIIVASGLLLWVFAMFMIMPLLYLVCYVFWRCPSCCYSWVWRLINTDIMKKKSYKISAAGYNWLSLSIFKCIDDYACSNCGFQQKKSSTSYKIDGFRLPFFN